MSLLSLVAALGSSIILLFIPVYKGVYETIPNGPATQQSISATLIEVNGYGVLIPLAIPPVLAAAGLAGIARAVRKLLIWAPALLLAAFVFITGFSIGMFYAPAMALLVASAILTQTSAAKME